MDLPHVTLNYTKLSHVGTFLIGLLFLMPHAILLQVFIPRVRTRAGNCDVSITSVQNGSCCELGPWVFGTCLPDGSITKTRSVSQLCQVLNLH